MSAPTGALTPETADSRSPGAQTTGKWAPRTRAPDPPHTCGGCDATWTALGTAHCSGCHRTFSAVALFDRHRSAVGEHGACLDPAEITTEAGEPVMVFRDGMWRGPEMTEEQKAAAFGSRS